MSSKHDNLFLSLLSRRWAAAGVAVALLAAAAIVLWPRTPAVDEPVAGDPTQLEARSAATSVDALARRLDAAAAAGVPQRSDQWALLGRSQAALGRHREAERAFSKASELAPGDAQLLAERAEAVLASRDANARTRATALVAQALAIDPLQPRALALGLGPDLSPARAQH